mgnify:CR=1 FL=1
MPIPPVLKPYDFTPPRLIRMGQAPPESKKERQPLLTFAPETKRFLLAALVTAAVLLPFYGMCEYIGSMKIGLIVLAVLVALFAVGIHASETNRPLLHESAGAATVAVKLGLLIPAMQIFGRGNLGWLIIVPYAFLVWYLSSSIGRRIGQSNIRLIVSTSIVVTFAWLGLLVLIGHLQASG